MCIQNLKTAVVLAAFSLIVLVSRQARASAPPTAPLRTDVLIVGGTESGWAAAIQAARMGVPSITIVHDGHWLGGQYTEQALACVDENKGNGKVGWGVDWHPMKRSFHRFGLFKELMDKIEAFNLQKYGDPMPGRPFHGPSTFRPAEAQAIFREMLQPYIESGQVRWIPNHYPVDAILSADGNRLLGLKFRSLDDTPTDTASAGAKATLTVHAGITIDASDFGEAIQVSGTEFEVGPDPQSRYDEPSAPQDLTNFPPNEMNPITWAMIVEESEDWSPIDKPQHFDDRNYPRATHLGAAELKGLQWDRPAGMGAIAHWPDAGKASPRQLSVYTVRRIVDGYTSKDGKTSILLNYMNGQDYPLERLPQRVADALEATEPGASKKNYVLLSRQQRQLIFDDAKQHSLGVLYHLQNFVHERASDKTNSFRKFRLSDEFGTADRLPPKPYIRESLRLKAIYMMREQDGRNFDGRDKRAAREAFAKVMYPDGVFSWQFHYDFHRTGRTYLKDEGESGPWIDYEKPGRHTRFVSDRSVFPLRSLVPVRMDGLIGAQRNIGNSSIVSAAIRLHDQGVHVGQAAGALAAVCVEQNVQPRDVPTSPGRLERVREGLCGGADGVPILLWPFRDLPADHPAFVAVNRIAAQRGFPLERRRVDFQPDDPATPQWREQTVQLCLQNRDFDTPPQPPVGEMTRGEFAIAWWQQIKDSQPQTLDFESAAWPAETPTEVNGQNDGIADLAEGDVAFNFTGQGSAAVDGFTNDYGLAFDPQRGRGWTVDIHQNHRRRGVVAEAYRDTFLFTRTTDTWELDVDNGTWTVTVCVGDSDHEQPGQYVFVEDQPVVEDVYTEAGQFFEQTATVEVKDGKLTVRIGNGKAGSNTCLNWLKVGR